LPDQASKYVDEIRLRRVGRKMRVRVFNQSREQIRAFGRNDWNRIKINYLPIYSLSRATELQYACLEKAGIIIAKRTKDVGREFAIILW
jgi:hypothetical protein